MLINSNIPLFITENSMLNKCQVELKQEDHSFLTHNSFLNCVDAHYAYDISFFKNELESNFESFYKGNISINCVRDIIQATNNSPVMVNRYKRIITEEFNQYLLDNEH